MLVLADKNSHWPNDIFCHLIFAALPPHWCFQPGLGFSPHQLLGHPEHPHLASTGVGTACRAEATLR